MNPSDKVLTALIIIVFRKEHHKIWRSFVSVRFPPTRNAEVILTKCLLNNRMQCLVCCYLVRLFFAFAVPNILNFEKP